MSTGNIQQSPKKISKSSTTANISCCRLCKSVEYVSCSKNIYRTLLAAAEDIYGQPLRQDKLLPHHHVGLVKDAWKIVFPSKQWLVKARVLSKQWSDVQKSHHLCHVPPPRLCISCMEDLLSHLLIPRNESKPRLLWSTIQGLCHWKPKSLRKERDGEKIYWSVTGPLACWTLKARSDRTLSCGGMLFAVAADKLDWYSAERRLEKEKCSFYCVLNQCTWCAYKTPSVLDNCLQLCICRFILIFGRSTLLHMCFWGILYYMLLKKWKL